MINDNTVRVHTNMRCVYSIVYSKFDLDTVRQQLYERAFSLSLAQAKCKERRRARSESKVK